MFGNNPIRGLEKGDGTVLYIQEIFRTFQGEGPFVGYPAVFVRLGGCNLACSFCDTEFESFSEMKLEDLLTQADELSGRAEGDFTHRLVVITGGEPFRQPIENLCNELITRGYFVQIETNGTLYRKIHNDVSIVCSPKNTGSGYHKIRDDLRERIDAFKFIISAHDSLYANVGDVGQGDIPVYVQPMDEYDEGKNKKNLELTIKLAQENGYRISLQLHKLVGVR